MMRHLTPFCTLFFFLVHLLPGSALAQSDVHRMPNPFEVDPKLVETIDAIRLADPGSPAEVQRYIRELQRVDLGMGGPTFQTVMQKMEGKYAQAGPTNVPHLIAALDHSPSPMSSHPITAVIQRLAEPEHAPLVLRAFSRHQEMVGAVSALKLEQEAREDLLKWLNTPGGQVSHGVIQAMARLNEPGTFPTLLRAFEDARIPTRQLHQELAAVIPAHQMERSLFIVWRKLKAGHIEHEVPYFTGVLAQNGSPEALKFLFEKVVPPPPGRADDFEARHAGFRWQSTGPEYIKSAFQVTNAPVELDGAGLKRWYLQNYHQLRYHPDKKMWLVPGLHPTRTWTDVDGRTIVARLVSSTDTTVTIVRSDGGAFTFPLERLSEEDRAYAASER